MELLQIIKAAYDFCSKKSFTDLGLFIIIILIFRALNIFCFISDQIKPILYFIAGTCLIIGQLKDSVKIELASLNNTLVSRDSTYDIQDQKVYRGFSKIKIYFPAKSIGIDVIIHQKIPLINSLVKWLIQRFNLEIIFSIKHPSKAIKLNIQEYSSTLYESDGIIKILNLNHILNEDTTTIHTYIAPKKIEDSYTLNYTLHIANNHPSRIGAIVKFVIGFLIINSKKELNINT
ncbi:hypothetical protein [uncultured Methanospirillum sp.]|uniref:hypothetical protein n=1 Tax=uncultured Methanospirillum sp. TaxID=262503 RepID=UPI0029C7F8E9|nr:hypothetical protein [uncultured Methanospirillum sp.]